MLEKILHKRCTKLARFGHVRRFKVWVNSIAGPWRRRSRVFAAEQTDREKSNYGIAGGNS